MRTNVAKISIQYTWFSLHFKGHCSRWTWVSGYQNFSVLDINGANDEESGDDDNGAIRRAKCHHQQTNNQCFTGWTPTPFLSPSQQCQSIETKHSNTI